MRQEIDHWGRRLFDPEATFAGMRPDGLYLHLPEEANSPVPRRA